MGGAVESLNDDIVLLVWLEAIDCKNILILIGIRLLKIGWGLKMRELRLMIAVTLVVMIVWIVAAVVVPLDRLRGSTTTRAESAEMFRVDVV
jgi:hypothetical protein